MKARSYSLAIIILTLFSFFILNNVMHYNKMKPSHHSLLQAIEPDPNEVTSTSLISPRQLNEIINNPDVKILYIQPDGSINRYIPNTRIIKYSDIVHTVNGIPGMIIGKEKMDELLSKLGIVNDDMIVIYDQSTTPYATRLFWTLKVYGHEYVKILNGGLDAWVTQGYKTDLPLQNIKPTTYLANDKNENMIATIGNIREAFKNNKEVILDVRSSEEYKEGHIPTAINVPYILALKPDGTFKSVQELQKIYEPLDITKDQTTIYVYCTKGNRASFTYFVLHELMGYNNVKVYDGSYTEYLKSGLPIEK